MIDRTRAALDCRIDQNPYDLAAILERLLLSASAGDFKEAELDARVFERIGYSVDANRALLQIARGEARVTAIGGVYIVGAPESVSADQVGKVINDARIALADFLRLEGKSIWVDFNPGPPHANATRLELVTVPRITLSRQLFDRPDWRSVLWHETAHATLSARNRFLDEGWAVWCQFRFSPETSYPALVGESTVVQLAPEIEEMPLSVLLEYKGRDLTFSDLATSESARRSIYVRAFRFVSAVYEKVGVGGLTGLYDRVSKGERVASVIEDVCGVSPEELEELSRRPQPAARQISRTAKRCDLAAARLALADARIGGRCSTLEHELELLRRVSLDHDAPRLRLIGLMRAETAISAARAGHVPTSSILDELDEAIVAVFRSGDRAGAELLKAQQAVVALLTSVNALGKAKQVEKAQRYYERAESLAPQDGEVALSFAVFELNKPFAFRNVDRAVELLKCAMREPACVKEVNSLVEMFTLSSRIKDETRSTFGGVAVQVRRISVSTAEGFTLDIGDLEVPRGSCFAVIGSNGSGKTTLLESMVGLRTASVADVDLLDIPLAAWSREPKRRRRFGVQTQGYSFPNGVRVEEIMRLRQACYGVATSSVDELGMSDLAHLHYGDLSSGQRQRVNLFVALAHEPDVAFLDEPSSGLDANYQEAVCRILKARNDRTIVLTSHEARDLDAATHILWLNAGKVQKLGAAAIVLKETVGSYRADVVLRSRAVAERWTEAILKCAPLRHYQILTDGRVAMCADDSLDPLLRPYLAEVESYAFGKAGYADLLRISSQEKPNG
jgi:ABC-2 type transport system ATP-binding protein